jgi:uncharacterized protein with FMN-binding domain
MQKTLWIIITIAVLGVITVYAAPKTVNNKTANTNIASLVLASEDETSDYNLDENSVATPTPTLLVSSSPTTDVTGLKDGNYTGNSASNPYGQVQISINISGGKITTVDLLAMPDSDSHSSAISKYVGPKLVAATLASQSTAIDTISGATYTSNSYIKSLQSALDQAKV